MGFALLPKGRGCVVMKVADLQVLLWVEEDYPVDQNLLPVVRKMELLEQL